MTNVNANLNIMSKVVTIVGDTLLRDFEEIIRLQSSIEGTEKLTRKALTRAHNTLVWELTNARPNYSLTSNSAESIAGKDPTRRWTVCAVSGADNFARGNPNWVVSAGLEHKGSIQVGVIYQPCLNELYKGVRGNGAYSRQMKLRVAPSSKVGNFILAVDLDSCESTDHPPDLKLFYKAFRSIRTTGSASLDLVNLSAGKIDGYIGFSDNAIETGPAKLLLTESGGLITPLIESADANEHKGLIAAGHHKFDDFKLAAAELLGLFPQENDIQ